MRSGRKLLLRAERLGTVAMSDSFTETTSVSWFGRIKRSAGGVVIGLILIIAMVVLLFWNEGRAVTTAKSLAEGACVVVSVTSDTIDPANDGRLIHVRGLVTTGSTPSDPDFGIEAAGIRLVRNAEMYQWKEESRSETTTKIGGGEETVTTYTYSKGWEDQPIDSSDFRKPANHANPSMEVRGQSFQVPEGKLGTFMLDGPVLDRIGGEKEFALKPEQTASIQRAFAGSGTVSVVNGRVYLGENPASPAIGDYRVAYEIVPLGDISVIARQSGSSFAPYPTVAGDQLLMVRTGTVAAEAMFADAVSENNLITWLLRLVGLVLLFVGFALFLSPLGVLADVLPFLGSIVRLGTGLAAFVLAILIGTATIALAWFYYRPLLALAILAVGGLIAFAIVYVGRSRRAGAAPVTARKSVV